MFFGRREFLKGLAWVLGAGQISVGEGATSRAAGEKEVFAEPGRFTEGEHRVNGEYDLVVVGGGLSGLACAISAARNGVKVALVHERSMLGGNSASEVRLYPEGTDAYQPWIRESGIHEEFHLEDRVRNWVRYREGLTNCHWDLVLYELAMREPTLTLMLNTHMTSVRMSKDKKRIASIHAIQLGTEKEFDLSAGLFVDATGDGVLGYRAGADFRWGREAQKEYGESLAPDEADERVMGNTLFYRAVDTGKPVTFVRPGWAAEFQSAKELTGRGVQDIEAGQWWIEVGAPYHPIKDNEEIRHECLRQLLGVWDYIKNKGEHGAGNYALDFVGFWPYKREARRIIGDAVLTQGQVQDPQQLEDAVAYGAWGIDIHFQGGILARHQRPYLPPHGGAFERLGTLPYGISLRSLYSRNVENMFTVGRNMSASYVGFCSSRVLSTGCIVGQAAGVAAGLCKKYGVMPREVAQKHAKECQQLILRQDGHIPGVENEDERDLARQAVATASSEMAFGMGEPVTAHELAFPRGQLFPVSGDRIETVSVYLHSKLDHDVEMKMTLRGAGQVWDFRSREDLGEGTAVVPAGSDGWVEFKLGAKVKERGLYWVWLPGVKGVYWKAIAVPRGVSHATPPGCVAGQRMGPTRWEQLGTGLCMGLKVTPVSKAYGAGNVNTGTHRPDRWTNIWMSDNELPAWVELKWEEKKKFNTVVLTFDTNQGRRENLPHFRYPDCVKDYDVEAMVGGDWKVVASGRENYLRRCEHRFEGVEADRVRVKVLGTNGAPMARVYEVRVYEEV